MIEVHDRIQAAAELEGLIRHPGWALLLDHLNEKRDEQQSIVVARETSTTEREAAAGEIRGITAAIQAPQALISRFRSTR